LSPTSKKELNSVLKIEVVHSFIMQVPKHRTTSISQVVGVQAISILMTKELYFIDTLVLAYQTTV
jgi:hypothetical protein